jgi:hypothetical protein
MRKLQLGIALLALATSAFAADKFAGTWKMNLDKSTGPVAPTATQLVSTGDGKIETVTVTGTNPDGTPVVIRFSFPVNGGPGTIIDATPFNSVTALKTAGNNQEFTMMIDGKPAMHIRSVLSADGKVMTTTRTVTAGPMKPGSYTDIWERQ